LAEPSSDQLRAVFRAHGVTGDIKEVIPRAGDEAVFIVTAADSFATTARELAADLQLLLARKVWVVCESATWEGRTTKL
jgi:hypothetical protein